MKLPLSRIQEYQQRLNNHELLIGNVITDIDGLHIFMENHVFAVWDFMSLLKCLQNHICPSTDCWTPNRNIRSRAARLINEIVLAEESDIDFEGNGNICHHDLYCQAMLEIGADATQMEDWIESVQEMGFYEALEVSSVPPAAMKFMEKTFSFIGSGESHIVASAFCFGRETIIPQMFQKLVNSLNITELSCPRFHYYLQRHIDVDGDSHGPASIEIIEHLCDGDPVKIFKAEQTAIEAIKARIRLWDDITKLIKENKKELRHG